MMPSQGWRRCAEKMDQKVKKYRKDLQAPHKEAEEREKDLVQEERKPALQSGSAGEHEDSHPIPLMVRSLHQREGAPQVRWRKMSLTLRSTTDSAKRATLTNRQTREATRSS